MADHDMIQGDTVALDYEILDEDGAPVHLNGATIRWQMARRVTTAPVVQKTVGDGITVVSAAGGTLTVMLDSADTQALFGEFYHELEVIDAEGRVTTPKTGTITINRGLIGP